MKIRIVITVAVCSLALASCANGGLLQARSEVRVTSWPHGAIVENDRGDSCLTPCEITLPNNRGGYLEVSLAGYETQTFMIGSHPDEVNITTPVPGYAYRPDTFDLTAMAVAYAADLHGYVRTLDTDHLHVSLMPFVEAHSERSEQANSDAVVYRLSDEEIAEIQENTDIESAAPNP